MCRAKIWSRRYADSDPHAARGGRRGRGRLPHGAAAADRGLPGGRRGGGTARARVDPLRRHDPLRRRIRRRLSHVLDRARVQPAAIARDAARGVRPGPGAGRHHHRGRDGRAAFPGLRLAGGHRAGRRAGDEFDGHRVEDAGRAHGTRHAARPRHHGCAAVPGSRRGRVPDRDSVAAQDGTRPRVGARARGTQGRRRADRHPLRSASGRCARGSTWSRASARRNCSC